MVVLNNFSLNQGQHGIASTETEQADKEECPEKLQKKGYHEVKVNTEK